MGSNGSEDRDIKKLWILIKRWGTSDKGGYADGDEVRVENWRSVMKEEDDTRDG